MNKERRRIIQQNEISEIREWNLGGYPQKVLLEGRRKELPIVVCLHGGPGTPIPFSVGCRGLFPEFTDHYIMVYWDQLGCGINDHPIDEHFTITQFVDMTVELIEQIKKMFPQNAVYLFGVSWGSILCAAAVKRIPELIDGVLIYGQILSKLNCNEECFATLLQSKAPEKIKSKIRVLQEKKAYTVNDIKALTKWVKTYTQGYENKTEKSAPVGKIIRGLLTSPDYRFKDFMAIVKNGCMKNESLIKEMITIDLRSTLQAISIPYMIIQGKTDIVASQEAIAQYVVQLNHDNITCTIVENAGHFPSDRAMGVVVERLEQLTKGC
ncbi:alpha/beta fold hydrolase [Anaerosporobacter faecicola]|uniref:alpha/beta fold hydrolase n=1 Tax=Anaerosporobacter faecicola TaxID=2718714 RepID=UPI00143C1515|nr:alpha/beta hydrolase [Anaerosporobacter faecicola]